MNISDYLIMDGDGTEIEADAQGETLAFTCPDCGHPVLAGTLENHRGSDEQQPAICKGCGQGYFLSPRLRSEKLYILQVTAGEG